MINDSLPSKGRAGERYWMQPVNLSPAFRNQLPVKFSKLFPDSFSAESIRYSIPDHTFIILPA